MPRQKPLTYRVNVRCPHPALPWDMSSSHIGRYFWGVWYLFSHLFFYFLSQNTGTCFLALPLLLVYYFFYFLSSYLLGVLSLAIFSHSPVQKQLQVVIFLSG